MSLGPTTARVILIGLMGWVMAASPALAGRNANGAMIVHTNDTYSYSTADACTTPSGDPGTCQNAITQTNKSSGSVIWILAAFMPSSSPGVSAIEFGIQYDSADLVVTSSWTPCGPGVVEAPEAGWPASCSGNAILFAAPVYAQLFPFYVLEVDNPSSIPGAFFSVTADPRTGAAKFVDDGVPPTEDACTCFGTIRWFAAGSNECPSLTCGQSVGACCMEDGTCMRTTESECASLGGTHWSAGVECCEANCATVPVRIGSWGSIKSDYR